jgi:hypothetical protein
MSFSARRATSTDDSHRLVINVQVGNHNHTPSTGSSEGQEASLASRVIGVAIGTGQGIEKNGGSLLK